MNQWNTTFLTTYQLCSGVQNTYKVDKQWAKEYKCKVGDILNCFFDTKRKGKWDESSGTKKWIQIDEYETVLKKYSIK